MVFFLLNLQLALFQVFQMNVLIYLPVVVCLCTEAWQRRCHSVTAVAVVAAAAAGASPNLTNIHGRPCRFHTENMSKSFNFGVYTANRVSSERSQRRDENLKH